ncbi:MAG: DUF1893 domain-containing protein [Oscillospiraceae bacterium]|nr:DUF1893 domain-containing protein [Oscillospiraceae bacterium]
MSDLERAKAGLDGHSLCLVNEDTVITDDSRGIGGLFRITGERDLAGFSCADLIIGRAAAMLYIKASAAAVHGRVMSEGAASLFGEHGIPCSWDTLTERIIDRSGKDICPMDKAVADTGDPNEGRRLIGDTLEKLRRQ